MEAVCVWQVGGIDVACTADAADRRGTIVRVDVVLAACRVEITSIVSAEFSSRGWCFMTLGMSWR